MKKNYLFFFDFHHPRGLSQVRTALGYPECLRSIRMSPSPGLLRISRVFVIYKKNSEVASNSLRIFLGNSRRSLGWLGRPSGHRCGRLRAPCRSSNARCCFNCCSTRITYQRRQHYLFHSTSSSWCVFAVGSVPLRAACSQRPKVTNMHMCPNADLQASLGHNQLAHRTLMGAVKEHCVLAIAALPAPAAAPSFLSNSFRLVVFTTVGSLSSLSLTTARCRTSDKHTSSSQARCRTREALDLARKHTITGNQVDSRQRRNIPTLPGTTLVVICCSSSAAAELPLLAPDRCRVASSDVIDLRLQPPSRLCCTAEGGSPSTSQLLLASSFRGFWPSPPPVETAASSSSPSSVAAAMQRLHRANQ